MSLFVMSLFSHFGSSLSHVLQLAAPLAAMSKVFKLTLVATMAELVWHVVAGMRVDKLFVIDSAGSTGSTAPSRRHLRSLDIPFLVIFAFVVEQTVSLMILFLLASLQCFRPQFLPLW